MWLLTSEEASKELNFSSKMMVTTLDFVAQMKGLLPIALRPLLLLAERPVGNILGAYGGGAWTT